MTPSQETFQTWQLIAPERGFRDTFPGLIPNHLATPPFALARCTNTSGRGGVFRLVYLPVCGVASCWPATRLLDKAHTDDVGSV